MFFTILFLFFYSTALTAISVEEQLLSETDQAVSETEETRDCFLAEQIQQSNIPLRITVPGNYCLVDNITVNRTQSFAISIETSNVTLDLNGYVITGADQNNANVGNNGVIINTTSAPRSNITIKNGTIRNMIQNGIIAGVGSSNIRLINVRTTNMTNNGVNIIGTNGCLIKGCVARFCLNGFVFGPSGTVICQQCVISNSFSSNNRNNGFLFNSFFDSTFLNTGAISNSNNGFNLTSGSRIEFLSCQAHNNATEGFLINGNLISFVGCFAYNNRTCGFDINGLQDSITECQAKSNGIGFQFVGVNNCILNSLAKSNRNTGILLLASSGQTQVRGNTATANGSGIVDNSAAITNRVYGNYANNNISGTNFGGNITNFVTSPVPGDAINFTTNIEN